jgi:hypothetical protein
LKDRIDNVKKEEMSFNDLLAKAVLKVFYNDEFINRTKRRLVRKGILTFLHFEFPIEELEKGSIDRICIEYISDYIKNELEKELETNVFPNLYIIKPIVANQKYRLMVNLDIEISNKEIMESNNGEMY